MSKLNSHFSFSFWSGNLHFFKKKKKLSNRTYGGYIDIYFFVNLRRVFLNFEIQNFMNFMKP